MYISVRGHSHRDFLVPVIHLRFSLQVAANKHHKSLNISALNYPDLLDSSLSLVIFSVLRAPQGWDQFLCKLCQKMFNLLTCPLCFVIFRISVVQDSRLSFDSYVWFLSMFKACLYCHYILMRLIASFSILLEVKRSIDGEMHQLVFFEIIFEQISTYLVWCLLCLDILYVCILSWVFYSRFFFFCLWKVVPWC